MKRAGPAFGALGDALARRLATRAGRPQRGTAPAAGKALVSRPAADVPQGEDRWTPVSDKATGLTYYWNERTGETTALGELPGQKRAQEQLGGGGFAKQLVSFAAYGAGVTLSFAAVRALFGY